MGGGGITGNDVPIRFPEKKAQIEHIFRKDHMLKNTPENRRLLLEMVEDRKYYIGKLSHNRFVYARTLDNGRQIWASVRRGKFADAGVNKPPLTDKEILKRLH
jgi:hypothetical protein